MVNKAKRFFNKVGSGLEKGVGEFTKATGKALGTVVGTQTGMALAEMAPALLAFKSGGRVNKKGLKKGAPLKAIVHQGEYVLPIGIKPTASQKKAVAKNKMTERMISGKLR
jgi:hypothetical protein